MLHEQRLAAQNQPDMEFRPRGSGGEGPGAPLAVGDRVLEGEGWLPISSVEALGGVPLLGTASALCPHHLVRTAPLPRTASCTSGQLCTVCSHFGWVRVLTPGMCPPGR